MVSLLVYQGQVQLLRVVNFQQTIMHVELELASGHLHKQNCLITWVDKLLVGGQLSPGTVLVWAAHGPIPQPWRHLLWTYPTDTEVLP